MAHAVRPAGAPRRRAAGVAVAVVAVSLGTAGQTAAGERENGRRIFEAQCAVCHATQPEFHKDGPSLAGVYGRRAGSAPYFAGYRGLKGVQFVWDNQTLDAWLADPRALLGGRDTSMTFRLADPAQRTAVIAYLETLR